MSFCSLLLATWIYHYKEEIEQLKKCFNEEAETKEDKTAEGTEKK